MNESTPGALSERLAEGVHCATALLHWLREEREALVTRDLAALHLAVEEKRRLVERLESLDGEAHALARARDHADDPGITRLRDRLREQLAECHDQNRINGAIIQRAQRSAAELTRLLTGECDPGTYGLDGNTSRIRGRAGNLAEA